MPPDINLPIGTREKLDRFRARVWRVKLAEGVFAALFGLVISYIGVFFLDRMFDTPPWVRIALLCFGSLGLAVVLPWKFHRWIWRTRQLEQVARLLRSSMPRISDRLLGIIELSRSDLEQQRSAALCAAALKQVDNDLRDVGFENAVPNPKHRSWALAAVLPLALVSLLVVAVPQASRNALMRWLLPWGSTARFTFTQLEPMPKEMIVPYGEPISITAALSPTTQWTPERAVAKVGTQPAISADLQKDRYEFSLAPQQSTGDLSIQVGDTAETLQLLPKQRPELREITATVALPEYLQQSRPVVEDVRSGTLSVLKGSDATLLASVSRQLQVALIDGEQVPSDGEQIRTTFARLDQDQQVALSWRDEFGLLPRSPFELKIETREDFAPQVTCSQLGRQQVVRVDQVVNFEVTADDDFGVKQIGIEWQGLEDPLTNPRPTSGSAILAAGNPEATSLVTQATFNAAREKIPPQTLQVRLFVVDYLPNREPVYSPPYTLFVMSHQEHANWLSERLKNWSQKAQGVYEREVQLYEENKTLRRMSAEELAQKSTRERIESQAAAERLNARQLNSITMAGKELIRDAYQNDQFNVATMEGLAEMVNTLEDLAKNRMPSVANLLKTSAMAKPAEESSPNDASGNDSKPSPQVGNQRAAPSVEAGSNDEQEASDDNDAPPQKPSIVDVESTMDTGSPNEAEESAEPQKPSPGGGGKFGIPTTTVYGGTQQQPEQPPNMEEALDAAIKSQAELLEDFTKVAEELQRILDNLEGSTFVKRLKAASRRQTEVARQLNEGLAEKFAQVKTRLSSTQQASTQAIAEQEDAERANLTTIKADLEAYYQRVQESKFGTVIREMDELQVMPMLEQLAVLVEDNLHGQSIAHAEFWADTFDRWAEQLVGPGCPTGGAAPPGSKGGSLSPSIVLDVMKILEQEISLRDETRATSSRKSAIDQETYQKRAESLAATQREISDLNAETILAITELENEKGLEFPTEKGMLRQVGLIMSEVDELLMAHQTDAPTIAAETEIIELLLKVQRKQPPKQKSKGSGGSQPGNGGEGDTEESALALLGRGDEATAERIERTTEQAVGTVMSGYPAEYRTGLDAYFSALEKTE